MCGRYELGLDSMDVEEYLRAIRDIQSLVTPMEEVREARPSQELPIITKLGFETASWGFPLNKKLLINARSEGIEAKRMFANAILTRRCLIPAKAYFEWTSQRVKYRVETAEPMTMAGLTLPSSLGDRFVIITTEANEQIEAIHHRMPVLLTPDAWDDYLHDTTKALRLLQPYAGPLTLQALTPEQLSLFD